MSRRADYGFGPLRPSAADPHLRVGDAERNKVADALSQHYSAGRLDDTELKQRLDQAIGAKTNADLAGLLSDLPPLENEERLQRPVARHHRGVVLWGALFLLFLAAAEPVHHFFWWWFAGPPWLLIGGVVGLVIWRRTRHRRYRPTGSQ